MKLDKSKETLALKALKKEHKPWHRNLVYLHELGIPVNSVFPLCKKAGYSDEKAKVFETEYAVIKVDAGKIIANDAIDQSIREAARKDLARLVPTKVIEVPKSLSEPQLRERLTINCRSFKSYRNTGSSQA
jgi:hypothetical protein